MTVITMTSSLLHADDAADKTKETSSSSLLVQALAVPHLETIHNSNIVQHSTTTTPRPTSPDPFLPRHSDFTIPTSNIHELGVSPPPLSYRHGACTPPIQNTTRRSIWGTKVEQQYRYVAKQQAPPERTTSYHDDINDDIHVDNDENHHVVNIVMEPNHVENSRLMSDLTPPQSPTKTTEQNHAHIHIISPLTPHDGKKRKKRRHHHKKSLSKLLLDKAHDSVYLQSLCLGLAFLAVWTPQNLMAPNLTEMARDFGFDDQQRDVYLGANLALATSVLSLPLSAGIGILADIYNRKHLFLVTVLVGAASSWATGASSSYQWLFLARLLNGGCMSGSVPIAFSLLGDLFTTQERNAASSVLTAMMGLGIIGGQVYAGMVGSTLGWSHAFDVSCVFSLCCALLVMCLVREPLRGGKEQVLQDMIRHGTRYERKLDWQGFCHAMRKNESNSWLLWQGFFSSVPWGIVFVFLNDYLSQERGFSIPEATYLVFLFGIGCALGGVLGGYGGQVFMAWNRSYLPLFMASTTFLGIFPFLLLLNGSFTNAHGLQAIAYTLLGGCIASLPSVNVRPCIINVNPPETRGAALTAANLIINLARGAGPSFITIMGTLWGVNRRFSFNVTLIFFWTVSAIQLVCLSRSLPRDQDAMETELARYAQNQIMVRRARMFSADDGSSIVSIEDRMTSFDAGAARETVQFMNTALRELGDELCRPACNNSNSILVDSSSSSSSGSDEDEEDLEQRRELWKQQKQEILQKDVASTEQTALLPR